MLRSSPHGSGTSPTYIPMSTIEAESGDDGVIGKGALGVVRRGLYRGQHVALKTLHMLQTDSAAVEALGGEPLPYEYRQAALDVFKRECALLSSLQHPNILPAIGIAANGNDPVYLVTPYIQSGTVKSLLYEPRYEYMRSAQTNTLDLAKQLFILEGMFAALQYLLQRPVPVLHRDIKPANILVEVANRSLEKVLLADFGEGREKIVNVLQMTYGTVGIGTLDYMAPEMREEEVVKGPKVDVFSAGIVMIEMNSGREPKPGPERRRRMVVPEEARRVDDVAAMHDAGLRQIAKRCIVDDYDARADASEILVEVREMMRKMMLLKPCSAGNAGVSQTYHQYCVTM